MSKIVRNIDKKDMNLEVDHLRILVRYKKEIRDIVGMIL